MLVRLLAEDLTEKSQKNEPLKADSGMKEQTKTVQLNSNVTGGKKDRREPIKGEDQEPERRYKGCDSGRDEILVRENAAKLLAKLALGNDQQKYLSYTPHLASILVKHLQSQLSLEEPNCVVVYSILKVPGA